MKAASRYISDGTRRSRGTFSINSLETAPEDFMYIPDMGMHVAKSKAKADNGDYLVELTAFHFLASAWRRGLNVLSSSDWGKSFKHFSDEGTTKGYTHGPSEGTSTFLAYREDGDYPKEVRDLLFQFNGDIALIDYPVAAMDNGDFLLDRGPRTRVVDVTDIIPRESSYQGQMPGKILSGYVKSLDEELGIPTELGSVPNKDYGENGAFCWMEQSGLKWVVRAPHMWISYQGKIASVEAIWNPWNRDPDIGVRLCSFEDPREALARKPIKHINKKTK